MSINPDALASQDNWDNFSIDPALRKNKVKAWFYGDGDVNPDGQLTYGSYLGLPALLSAQRPGTCIPDERIFIITHQLCELAFKQMLFDLEVLAETFSRACDQALKQNGLERLLKLHQEFWRPALTAAARLSYTSTKILPTVVGYLAYNHDPTFDSAEFGLFREKLIPASGFQSAQFRAIQAGLGKSNILNLRIYPSAFYRRHYHTVTESEAVSPSDPLIVREEIPFGSSTDDMALELLAALSNHAGDVITLREEDFLQAEAGLKRGLKKLARSRQIMEAFGETDRSPKMIEEFRRSVTLVILDENARRAGFAGCVEGWSNLMKRSPGHPLVGIIRMMKETDKALHGPAKGSFLSLHRRFVNRRIKEVNYYAESSGRQKQTPGTGGGGMPYLELMHRNIIPLFPSLVGIESGRR